MFEHEVVLWAAIELLIEFTACGYDIRQPCRLSAPSPRNGSSARRFLYLLGSLGHESTRIAYFLQTQLIRELDAFGEAGVIHDLVPGEVAAWGFQA